MYTTLEARSSVVMPLPNETYFSNTHKRFCVDRCVVAMAIFLDKFKHCYTVGLEIPRFMESEGLSSPLQMPAVRLNQVSAFTYIHAHTVRSPELRFPLKFYNQNYVWIFLCAASHRILLI